MANPNPNPNVDVGDLVWCIKPSIESEQYGDFASREPWQGKITHLTSNGSYLTVSPFDSEGIPDTDTNASAQCYPEEVYATKAEALRARREILAIEIQALKQTLAEWELLLADLSEK